MNSTPFTYNDINMLTSKLSPSTIKCRDSLLYRYFARYLLQKAISVFKWNLPDTWASEYFIYNLYINGYMAVINTNKFGVIPQTCGLRGYDVMYRPTNAVIANPLLQGILEPRINKQCTLIRLTPDYRGIMDIIEYYANLMSLASESLTMNLVNSKLSYVFTTDSKSAAEGLKKLYDDIMSGNPMVVMDKDLRRENGEKSWEAFEQNVGQNYLADKILIDLNKIEDRFDTDVGIPNANTDKKERLVVAEVNANNEETSTLCELWLEELQKGCTNTNNMFGTTLSVDWRNKPKENGGVENERDT